MNEGIRDHYFDGDDEAAQEKYASDYADYTHLTEAGADHIAGLIADLLAESDSPLKTFLLPQNNLQKTIKT